MRHVVRFVIGLGGAGHVFSPESKFCVQRASGAAVTAGHVLHYTSPPGLYEVAGQCCRLNHVANSAKRAIESVPFDSMDTFSIANMVLAIMITFAASRIDIPTLGAILC